MGAPKLTPERQTRILEKVALGMTYRDACTAAGIAESTFYYWKQRGREAKRKTIYSEFLEALKRADAECEEKHLRNIETAAIQGQRQIRRHYRMLQDGTTQVLEVVETDTPPAWQASAWILQRKHPDRYALKVRDDIRAEMQAEIDRLSEVHAQILEAGLLEVFGDDPRIDQLIALLADREEALEATTEARELN